MCVGAMVAYANVEVRRPAAGGCVPPAGRTCGSYAGSRRPGAHHCHLDAYRRDDVRMPTYFLRITMSTESLTFLPDPSCDVERGYRAESPRWARPGGEPSARTVVVKQSSHSAA
ncbi:hypothetical protein RHA1_ro11097 (plasmid) [Rhodococcus jostii RHA1]|uniref:Uncharacterized protein n=1 Tax=Rhodococcus jostii (strain RHA1) TaxID=101510 RepID=Q0RVE2_RHOJR|nr:hypothetical protein RHA1_ro11097 [Rhodococcus jostii RHA1]